MPSVLRLTVSEFTDRARWRWTLTDAGGAFLADHQVRLNQGDWEYEAAEDLPKYISWHASPDERYAEDEARIVGEVGAWLGANVLGPDIAQALARRRNATVQVILPPDAEALAFLPLEISHVNGQPLAQLGITLVLRTGDPAPNAEAEPRERLRVLGLFSLPEGESPLNLRRERHALVQLINGIAANGQAAEIRVLQYGVTRKRLQDVLEEADGWDIIHISGHGAPGTLLLETEARQSDPITTSELGDLLDLARDHVQLITLSACWSASLGAAEQRRMLQLPVDLRQARSVDTAGSALGSLATDLTERLGCAVLAMRYPVDDEFAIGLSAKLYELLAAKGQPLPRAVAMTVKQLAAEGGTGGRTFPALSVAAPAIFGDRATDLRLRAPERTGPISYATGPLKLARFPPQPARFVGRTAVMAQASEVLAPNSGVPGVLLHGMPGGGKTACALELAYTHEETFDRLIWFKAPDEDMAIDGSLNNFALTLEQSLNDFQMAHVLADDQKLTGFLPQLTELMEQHRLLIAIDNAESLLTETGQWRDRRWGQVIGAFSAHSGLSRILLTSRRVPAVASGVSAETQRLRVLPVDALSPDEALLLSRELPHLNRLIRGDLPGLDRETSRRLGLGVLNITHGHPELLKLANGQAAHPNQLAALIDSGDQAWLDQGSLPGGFFTSTATAAAPDDYLHVLAVWTWTVIGVLSPDELELFWFLCCLEEPDRIRPILDGNWPGLWRVLHYYGKPPDLDHSLAALVSTGLVALRQEGEDESYGLHPGVAAAGRNQAQSEPGFQSITDSMLAAHWRAVFNHSRGKNDRDTVHTEMSVHAGLSAIPYLLREKSWETAVDLLDNVFIYDSSKTKAAVALPLIEQISKVHDENKAHDENNDINENNPFRSINPATYHATRIKILQARILLIVDPDKGESSIRNILHESATQGDFKAASVTAGILSDLCLNSGRPTEALNLTSQLADHVQHSSLGPWSQLACSVQRLRILNAMGRISNVLTEFDRLQTQMKKLHATSIVDHKENVSSWNVREILLDVGRSAALQLNEWQHAIDLNAEIIASQHNRHAPAATIARARFKDYRPLLLLDRTAESIDLLQDCHHVFHSSHDTRGTGNTFSALADTEYERGHSETAIRLERDALRYSYLAGDIPGIAVSYHNLGRYLACSGQPESALSSHLTAALIRTVIDAEGAGRSLEHAAIDLQVFDTETAPANMTDLFQRIGDIPGTDPNELIESLYLDPENAEKTFRKLITQAWNLASVGNQIELILSIPPIERWKSDSRVTVISSSPINGGVSIGNPFYKDSDRFTAGRRDFPGPGGS